MSMVGVVSPVFMLTPFTAMNALSTCSIESISSADWPVVQRKFRRTWPPASMMFTEVFCSSHDAICKSFVTTVRFFMFVSIRATSNVVVPESSAIASPSCINSIAACAIALFSLILRISFWTVLSSYTILDVLMAPPWVRLMILRLSRLRRSFLIVAGDTLNFAQRSLTVILPIFWTSSAIVC